MKKIFALIGAFIVGAGSGVGGCYILLKKKYEDRFQKDREEMIAYYRNKQPKKVEQKPATEEPEFTEEERTDMMAEARRISDENKYRRQYGNVVEDPVVDDSLAVVTGPYIIDGITEAGTLEGYEQITLRCYEDGVIVDDEGEVLTEEDIEEYVGTKNIDELYRAGADSIYVRNDKWKRDYEIIEKIGRYADD